MIPEYLMNVCQRKSFMEKYVGKCTPHGGQKKRYKNTFKASLKDSNIPTEPWEEIAQDKIEQEAS